MVKDLAAYYCIQEGLRLNRFMIDGNYPSVALVESLYKRIKARDKGIPQQLLIKSRTMINMSFKVPLENY